jgi:aminomethyltransferase
MGLRHFGVPVKLQVEGNTPPADSFLYDGKQGKRIGTIKTQIWSPLLKANLAMAEIEYRNGKAPKNIWAEIYYQKELEWRATWGPCSVSDKPFWIHPRRSLTPPERY